MKKIILTGGGTAGHVTPNIALLPGLKRKGYEVFYVGTKDGMERELVEREGIAYHYISAGKLRRYFDLKNFIDIFKILTGFLQALSIMRRIKPNIVFSKGGFVACPVVWAAWIFRIPVIIHESDITPGLANKLSAPFAKKICYTFPETEKYIKADKKIFAGMPVREELRAGDSELGRRLCDFTENRPVVLIIGGSQGSGVINNFIREELDKLLLSYQVCHICGKGNIDTTLEHKRGYKQFEYVKDELTHLFAMTDIFISRAGATTIFEIVELKKPSILIPLSKKVSRGDQLLNAASFEKQGFCKVLQEEELENLKITDVLDEVLKNKKNYMSAIDNSDINAGNGHVLEIIDENTK